MITLIGKSGLRKPIRINSAYSANKKCSFNSAYTAVLVKYTENHRFWERSYYQKGKFNCLVITHKVTKIGLRNDRILPLEKDCLSGDMNI